MYRGGERGTVHALVWLATHAGGRFSAVYGRSMNARFHPMRALFRVNLSVLRFPPVHSCLLFFRFILGYARATTKSTQNHYDFALDSGADLGSMSCKSLFLATSLSVASSCVGHLSGSQLRQQINCAKQTLCRHFGAVSHAFSYKCRLFLSSLFAHSFCSHKIDCGQYGLYTHNWREYFCPLSIRPRQFEPISSLA